MTHAVLAAEAAVPLDCPSCGPVDGDLDWRMFADGTIHVQASCPACHRWLKFVRQEQHVLDLLPPPPTGPEQRELW